MRWEVFDGALNADILVDFLHRLIKDTRRKIYQILNNLWVHHSKPVKAWAATRTRDRSLLSAKLPLELNLSEMANADLRQVVTKLIPARTKLQLVKATSKHWRSPQCQPD